MLIYEGGTESFSEFISDEVDASYAGCELESSFLNSTWRGRYGAQPVLRSDSALVD